MEYGSLCWQFICLWVWWLWGFLFFFLKIVVLIANSQLKWSEVKLLSCVRLFVTPWTVAYQAPPSMGFSRQEYWRGLPLPSPLNECKFSVTLVSWCCAWVVFSRSGMSSSLRPRRLQHTRLLCPLCPGVWSHSCSLSQWGCLTISSSATPFSICCGW